MVNNQIGALQQGIAQLQTQLQEAQRAGNVDLTKRLLAGIARRSRRLEDFRAQPPK
jgi:hypothetical protein